MALAREIGYDCVEVMCWPLGKSARRYAGVTHIDVSNFGISNTHIINELCNKYEVKISSLGYYPNALTADKKEAQVYIDHIKKMIEVAATLGLNVVITFVGRDHTKSVEDNWLQFEKVWKDIVSVAVQTRIKVAIENCPMLFTNDEWPGGKNLATAPSIWKKMFESIPSEHCRLRLKTEPEFQLKTEPVIMADMMHNHHMFCTIKHDNYATKTRYYSALF